MEYSESRVFGIYSEHCIYKVKRFGKNPFIEENVFLTVYNFTQYAVFYQTYLKVQFTTFVLSS